MTGNRMFLKEDPITDDDHKIRDILSHTARFVCVWPHTRLSALLSLGNRDAHHGAWISLRIRHWPRDRGRRGAGRLSRIT
jgi:hypothetical protein